MIDRRTLAAILLISLMLFGSLTAVVNLDGTSHSLRTVPVEGGDRDCFRLTSGYTESEFEDIHVQLIAESTVVTERTIPVLKNGASEPICAPNGVDRVNITNFAIDALPSESWVVITSYGKPAANGTVNESAPRGYLETQEGEGPYPPKPILSTIFPGLLTSLAIVGTAATGLAVLLGSRCRERPNAGDGEKE